MGLRDRLESSARQLGEMARDVAGSEPVQTVTERLPGLRSLLGSEGDDAVTLEHFLLALVRAVRSDEEDDELSDKDVFKAAKRRRRRLGVVSLGAGPLAGAANQLADLYCDTATVCDLVDLHGLELSDAEIAALMLELWNVAGSSEQASAAITATGDSISELLVSRVKERASEQIPEKWTKRSAAKALWDARGIPGDVAETAGSGAVSTVVFSGRKTRQLIARVEAQLGVRSPDALDT